MYLNFPMKIGNNVQDFFVPLPTNGEPKTSLHVDISHMKRVEDHSYNRNVPKKVRVFQVVKLKKPENVVQSGNTANDNIANSSAPVSEAPVTPENLEIMPNTVDISKENGGLKDFYENFDTPESQDLTMDEPKNDNMEINKSKIVHELVWNRVEKRKLKKQFNGQIKTEPGIYSTVMVYLERVIEKLKSVCKEKICTILFDELVLDKYLVYCPSMDKIIGYVDFGDEGGRTEEIADRVLVFMIQDIKKVMRHPIAHYFLKGKMSAEVLSLIIKNIIRKVRETGFTVIATVCDQAPTHVEALNLLKGADACADLNYFLIDDKKVYIVYDVPHLFKSIRNNLIRYGELVLDNKSVKLSHLHMVETKNSSALHFTKITKEHVSKIDWSKRGIKLAIEILSNTVSGVLKALSESKVNIDYKDEIFEAGEVIQDLDNLFDCTNGTSCSKGASKPSRAKVQTSSFHHSLWVEYKNKLKNTHFLNTNCHPCVKEVRCINGLLITLSSLQDIWQCIEQEALTSFNLNCLNMDSLEELFKIIEVRKPQKFNHVTSQFYEVCISNIFLEPLNLGTKKTNCENDDDNLLDFSDLAMMEKKIDDVFAENSRGELMEDYDEPKSEKEIGKLFNRFEKLPNVYISAYLAAKLLKEGSCEKCCNVLELAEIESASYHSCTLLRKMWRENCSPIYPSKKLRMTVEKAVKVFDLDVKPVLYVKNVLNYCVAAMLTECDTTWMCEEHGTIMEIHLFRLLGSLLIRNHCRLENNPNANIEVDKYKSEVVNKKRKKIKKQNQNQITLHYIQYSDEVLEIING